MLDAATCGTMRSAVRPVAAAPALAELRALLSEVLTRDGTGDEIPESGRVGFRDRHQGDRHAASVTPSAEPAAGAVPREDAASAAGCALMGDAAGADPACADGAGGGRAGCLRARRAARCASRRRQGRE